MNKKLFYIKLALAPFLPIIGAITQHYSPPWITEETWFLSNVLAASAYLISIFFGERL
jgi:hypothetical protein